VQIYRHNVLQKNAAPAKSERLLLSGNSEAASGAQLDGLYSNVPNVHWVKLFGKDK
jgi:hypothetical protein